MDYEGFVELIEAIGTGEKNTALEIRTILYNILQCIYLPGDIKIVICTQEDLDNDYDETGLGRGKRAGWAQCNGLNGTKPFGGRVPIGLSDNYPVIGDIGGSSTHTLTIEEMPAHKHVLSGITTNTSGGSSHNTIGTEAGTPVATSTVGGGEPHSIMQPWVAVVYLEKK